MGRRLKFTIIRVKRGGRSLWRIRIPARFSPRGVDTDVYYRSKDEAVLDQVRLRGQLNEGSLVGKDVLAPQQVRDAFDALALLKEAGCGLSLREAVQEALQARAALLRGITVAELLERYAEDAAAARGWSVKYRSTWRQYSTRFAADFGGRNIASVQAAVAKTRQVRNVQVRPALQAFLDLVPVEGREGALVPGSWKRKAGAVRAGAGLQFRADAARHSFASYALAAGESVDAVRADLGHARGSDMLFRHYRAAVSPAAAAEFWALRP